MNVSGRKLSQNIHHDVERENKKEQAKFEITELTAKIKRLQEKINHQYQYHNKTAREKNRLLRDKKALSDFKSELEKLTEEDIRISDFFYSQKDDEPTSRVGRAVINVASVALTPLTILLDTTTRFVVAHPVLTASAILASCFLYSSAQILNTTKPTTQENTEAIDPLNTTPTREEKTDSKQNNRNPSVTNTSPQKKMSFLDVKKQCEVSPKLDFGCEKQLGKVWRESASNVTEQEEIENYIHKNQKKLLTRVKVEINKQAKLTPDIKNENITRTEEISDLLQSHTLIHDIKRDFSKGNALNTLSLERIGNLTDTEYSLDKMHEYASLANYPYIRNRSALHEGWSLNKRLAQALAYDAGFGYDRNSGQIYTSKGLVAYPMVKKEGDNVVKVCLVFGGTTAGFHAGEDLASRNRKQTLNHFETNIENVVGFSVPSSYKQAVKLATHLELRTKQRADPPIDTEYSGHSLGGSTCTYVTEMISDPYNPSPCFGFASAPINGAMKKEIVKRTPKTSNIDKITRAVRHVVVEGDPIPNVRNHVNGAGKVGIYHKIEQIGEDSNKGAIEAHAAFYDVISSHKALVRNSTAPRTSRHTDEIQETGSTWDSISSEDIKKAPKQTDQGNPFTQFLQQQITVKDSVVRQKIPDNIQNMDHSNKHHSDRYPEKGSRTSRHRNQEEQDKQ